VDRLTVREAALRLNISESAVRMRLHRGTLTSEQDDNGRTLVLLPSDNYDSTSDTQPEADARLIEILETQNEFLRQQLQQEREANRENRRLLALQLEHMRALEPPREAPAETASEEPYSTHAPTRPETPVSDEAEPGAPYGTSRQEAEESLQPRKRSWWREFFGME
jgi:hypothetical protein